MVNKETINTDEWNTKIRGCVLNGLVHQADKNRILLRLIENLIMNVSELNERVKELESELKEFEYEQRHCTY